MTMSKTIVLVHSAGRQTSELDMFHQMFARNLAVALNTHNAVSGSESMNEEKLASMLNIARAVVSDWISGHTLPDAWHLQKLSKLLNVPSDTLINPNLSASQTPPLMSENYHCITIHDEKSADKYAVYALPETLRHLNLPRNTMMLLVSNDDMVPMFKPGDIAIYDPRGNTVMTNGIYVLRSQGKPIIRQIQKKTGSDEATLLCENRAMSGISISSADLTNNPETEGKIFVMGRVLGRINIGSL